MISTRSCPDSLQRHQFAALEPGPRLLVLGAVHGNETCGTRAIERLLPELTGGGLALRRGLLSLVPVSNPLAYRLHTREGERNLNRNMGLHPYPANVEDRISNVLCPWIAEHDVILDLHSFHTGGAPFAMLGPENNDGDIEPFAQAVDEQRMALHLGARRIVEGWMSTYARGVARRRAAGRVTAPDLLDRNYGMGTTEYGRTAGCYGITLECGQHDDPAAPDVAYHAIRQVLALLGMADIPLAPPPPDIELIRLVDVIDMEDAGASFVREWDSFDRVRRGETIGHRADGTVVTAPDDGYIVFPNPGALPGNEWFYFGVASTRQL